MIVLFSVLACIALLLALHPYTTFPLSLAVLARLRNKPEQPKMYASRPKESGANESQAPVAILLCVHNEENVIEARMRNLIELADQIPGTEILVYTDGSTDSTVDILRTFGERITLEVSPERTGKTHGMNLLVTRTQARLIVFTDAAVKMNNESLPNMMRHFDDPDVGCVCGRIIAVSGGANDEITATADTSIKYWAFDALIRRLETKVASVMGAHGPLFAIRRSVHEPAPIEYFDDFYVSMAVLYNGHRIVQAEDFCGFKAVATRREDEYRRKIRIACQSFHIHRIMKPRLQQQTSLVRYLYAGHKTLRWLTIFSLAAAALFGSVALAFGGFGLLVLIGWAVFAAGIGLGFAGIKPFAQGLEAFGALVANGVGVIESLNGKVYQTWASAKSARAG
jgi:cellulose synthase/poly-beta-1,6-N-acetylglucosamine synthase-like glycosyltransferase